MLMRMVTDTGTVQSCVIAHSMFTIAISLIVTPLVRVQVLSGGIVAVTVFNASLAIG